MLFTPMRGDVDTPREPHLGMIGEPVEHLGETEGAARMGNDAVVQSEAEHPRRILVDHAMEGILHVVDVVATGDYKRGALRLMV
jgi:hypothetical protein